MTFEQVTKEMNELYLRKNADYGNSFEKTMDTFGIIAPVIRLNDKVNRLTNIVKSGDQKVNESIEDTLLDLANYSVMTLAYLKSHDLPSYD